MTNITFRIFTLTSTAILLSAMASSSSLAQVTQPKTSDKAKQKKPVLLNEKKAPVLLDGQKNPVLLDGQKIPVLLNGQKAPVLLKLQNSSKPNQIPDDKFKPNQIPGDEFKPNQIPGDEFKPNQVPIVKPPVTIITPTTPVVQEGKIKASFVSPTSGKHYFFTDKRYFRYGKDSGFDKAANIKDNWAGIPEDFDAAFVSSKNNKAYFFKGSQYDRWRFSKGVDNNRLSISRYWKGIPNNIDAVVEHPNGKIYFFKGDTYYRYNNKKVEKSGKISQGWPGVPNNIDAVLKHANGKIYFLKGNQYYRFNIEAGRVDNPPSSTIGNPGWRGLDFDRSNFTKKISKPLKSVTKIKNNKGSVTQRLNRDGASEDASITAKITKTDKEDSKGRTCTTQRRQFSDANIDHFLKASNSSIEVLGNIIEGNDLFSGKYKTETVAKNKYRLFISPSLGNADNYVDIENPSSQSEVSRAIDLLRQRHLPTVATLPQNTALNISAIESATEAKLKIGGSFDSPYVDVNTLFKFDRNQKTKKYLAEYAATYYTIRLEKLNNNPITKPSVNIDPNWVYVSEVKYGKRFLFALDTNESEKTSRSALNVKGQYGVYKTEADLNSAETDSRKVTSIKQIVQGGGIENLSGDFPDNIMNVLSKDTYSKHKPGAAVSSVLRFVDGDDVAQVSTTADYTERVCFRTSNIFKVTLNNIFAFTQNDGPGDVTSEVFGNISIHAKDVRGYIYTPIHNNYGASGDRARGKYVWMVKQDNAKDMSDGTRIQINRFLTFKIPTKELQNAQLFIHGNLFEHDSWSSNDVLGRNILKIDLKNVTEQITVGGVQNNQVPGQSPDNAVYSSDEGQYYIPVTIEPITEK